MPARILQRQHAELHREWCSLYPSSLLSLTTFSREVRSLKVYKPVSKRGTDVCDHCMDGKRHEVLMDRLLRPHLPQCPFLTTVQHVIEQYKSMDAAPLPLSSYNPSLLLSADR